MEKSNYNESGVVELCDYIMAKHIDFETEAMSSIKRYLHVLLRIEHGSMNMVKVSDEFSLLADELEQHIGMEDKMIFPFLAKSLGDPRSPGPVNLSGLDTVLFLMQNLCTRQKPVLDRLAKIRTLTAGYYAEVGAAPTHKLCMRRMEQFDRNIQQHFFIEKNILLRKVENLVDTLRNEITVKEIIK